MTTFSTSIFINRPPAEVYERFTDLPGMRDWIGNFVSFEPVQGELRHSGSRFRMAFKEMGRDISMEHRILQATSGKQYDFVMDHDSALVTNRVVFIPRADGQTELRCDVVLEAKNFMFKMALPALKGRMEARQREDFQRLKALLEG